MKLCLLAVLALFFAASSRASLEQLSLQDAVRFALEHSPLMDTARKTQSIRDLEYKSAIAKMLPSADFSSSQGLQNNIPLGSNNTLLTANPSSPWYSSLSLGVTENLYDNGVSLTGAKIADLSRDLASTNYLKSRDSVALSVAAEFYKYSLASSLYDVKKQQQLILEKQFKTLSSQYQQGFKTKSDYLRLKTQVQRAEIDSITAQNNIELSGAVLRKLLGVELREIKPPLFLPVLPQRDQKLESLIPSSRPDLENVYDYRISKIQDEVNERNVTLVRRNYWPRVFVTAAISYSNMNYINAGAPFSASNQLSWNTLLGLQYNLWDWGSRRRDVEVAEYNRDILGNQITQNLLDVNAQISSLMLELLRIGKSYKLSQELLVLEEESNRNVESQYREGKVAYLDLITSLNNLLDAKVQFYTSYFDALQAVAKYKYLEGKLYEALVEK